MGRVPPAPVNLVPWAPGRPEWTEAIHQLTQAAFAPYASLVRPSGALAESLADVETDLAAGGGLIAYDDTFSTPLGALRWRVEADHLWVKRIAVDPARQYEGVGNLLLEACRGVAQGFGRDRIRLGVRHALATNRTWFERHGYRHHVDHDDWAELETTVEPYRFRERTTFWKFDHPDHLQGTMVVDVLEERPDGMWVLMPQYLPARVGDQLIWVPPGDVVGWLPQDTWWTAWFSQGHQRVKVDICTPFLRRDDGDLEIRDLCLDVVVWGDEPAKVVDEDEFAEAAYPADIAARALAATADVLRQIQAGEEPFASEGHRRLDALRH